MRDDEIAEVHRALIDMVRENGWESLFELISTPFDIEITGSGSRMEIRRLVKGLTDLIEMLPQLETSIAVGEPNIKVVILEVDPVQFDDRTLSLPKFERGSVNIDGDRYGALRQILQELRTEIETYD